MDDKERSVKILYHLNIRDTTNLEVLECLEADMTSRRQHLRFTVSAVGDLLRYRSLSLSRIKHGGLHEWGDPKIIRKCTKN